jgi:hypothetical protein
MMHRWYTQEFQVLRVLEPALRMKAQVDSNSRGRKDFICREEKRKSAYWRMQGHLETSDPVDWGGEWGFIAFLYCLMAEMPFRCKWAFPREKCLLDHLSPFGTSCSLSFSPSPMLFFPFWTFSLKVSCLPTFKAVIFPSSLFHLLTFWSLKPRREAGPVKVQ